MKEFLLLDEVKSQPEENISKEKQVSSIDVKNLSVTFNPNSTDHALSDIDLSFSADKLYIVAGPVGSGKSTLLKTILHELQPTTGHVEVTGQVSYACQESWLFSGTVRGNILFGQRFEEKRYERVVDACELNDDLDKLPDGDSTRVGDRGCTLSGGQKARVNLARAIYRDADVYLIDDAFAAVDARVGKSVFEKCLKEFLKGKIRILVSNNAQYFKDADEIVVITKGKVDLRGTYESLLSTGYRITATQLQRSSDPATLTRTNSASKDAGLELKFAKSAKNAKPADKRRERGESVCWRYFRSGGSICALLCLATSLLLAQASVSGCDYWLAHWMKSSDTAELRSSLYILAGLLLTSAIAWTASSLLFYKICTRASENLHERMLASLVRAPVRFFDANPSGRILNRFSKDTGLVDETLPAVTLDALHVILMMAGVAVQVFIVNWWTLFPAVLMGWCCCRLKGAYLPVAKDLRRLESRAKSPVFSRVATTLSGLPTIRSSRAQAKLAAEFDSLQNVHTSAHHLNVLTSSAFGFWLDVISVCLLAFVTFSFIVVKDAFASAWVGLAVTQLLMLYGSVQYGLRQTAEMMTQMVSVERIFQFVDLEREGPFENELVDGGLGDWPSEGRIEVDGLVMRYADDEEPVLRNVAFSVKPGEKIGVVGRTGAGKTSVISALFRLVNPEGSLVIDEVDIKTVGLHKLRSGISIIPQDPVLFSASVRDNIDPLRKYGDDATWKAVEDVTMKDQFDSLDSLIENRGNNLSTGQKQLLCLARVLVAKNKILILDEATANVDEATDEIIKRTIKTRFADCTILTIAHRLNTVMDSDRILIINEGEVIEFDEPKHLIERKTDFFSHLIND